VSGDLFSPATKPTGPHSALNAPETSRKAADKVRPALPSIRLQVLAAFEQAGAEGLIDEELRYLAENDLEFDRSIRPRRTELTDENWILDSSRRRNNARGNPCVVWVHRKFVSPAPPIVDKAKPVPSGDRAAARAMAKELEAYATAFLKEGRPVYSRLQEAARLLRDLSR
jgi:hypothetical protein